jgi:hypothetical protein
LIIMIFPDIVKKSSRDRVSAPIREIGTIPTLAITSIQVATSAMIPIVKDNTATEVETMPDPAAEIGSTSEPAQGRVPNLPPASPNGATSAISETEPPTRVHTAEDPVTDESMSQLRATQRSLAPSLVLYLTIYIIASELQLKWNHLEDINSVSSTGQIIPLCIGAFSLLRAVLMLRHVKWSELMNARQLSPLEIADQTASWAYVPRTKQNGSAVGDV